MRARLESGAKEDGRTELGNERVEDTFRDLLFVTARRHRMVGMYKTITVVAKGKQEQVNI